MTRRLSLLKQQPLLTHFKSVPGVRRFSGHTLFTGDRKFELLYNHFSRINNSTDLEKFKQKLVDLLGQNQAELYIAKITFEGLYRGVLKISRKTPSEELTFFDLIEFLEGKDLIYHQNLQNALGFLQSHKMQNTRTILKNLDVKDPLYAKGFKGLRVLKDFNDIEVLLNHPELLERLDGPEDSESEDQISDPKDHDSEGRSIVMATLPLIFTLPFPPVDLGIRHFSSDTFFVRDRKFQLLYIHYMKMDKASDRQKFKDKLIEQLGQNEAFLCLSKITCEGLYRDFLKASVKPPEQLHLLDLIKFLNTRRGVSRQNLMNTIDFLRSYRMKDTRKVLNALGVKDPFYSKKFKGLPILNDLSDIDLFYTHPERIERFDGPDESDSEDWDPDGWDPDNR